MSEPNETRPTTVRHDGWTPDRQSRFLEVLANSGSVSTAARAVGMTTQSAYRLRRRPDAETFRAAWDNAVHASFEMLSDLAVRRAVEGAQVPIVSRGEIIGHRTVHNDRLLMFLLRHRHPIRYSPLAHDPDVLAAGAPPEARDSLYEDLDEIEAGALEQRIADAKADLAEHEEMIAHNDRHGWPADDASEDDDDDEIADEQPFQA